MEMGEDVKAVHLCQLQSKAACRAWDLSPSLIAKVL